MKKNNKGFMLVEVIVVSVVVVSIMTSLFVVFNRVYNAYDKKGKYTDIDSIYALKMLEDYMIENEINNSFIINTLVNNVIVNDYYEISCESDNTDFKTYCNALFTEYNVNKMYIVKNTANSINNLKNNDLNESFKDFLDYLINIGVYSDEFSGKSKGYSELLVVETYTIKGEENTLNKYAYLPIKIKK